MFPQFKRTNILVDFTFWHHLKHWCSCLLQEDDLQRVVIYRLLPLVCSLSCHILILLNYFVAVGFVVSPSWPHILLGVGMRMFLGIFWVCLNKLRLYRYAYYDVVISMLLFLLFWIWLKLVPIFWPCFLPHYIVNFLRSLFFFCPLQCLKWITGDDLLPVCSKNISLWFKITHYQKKKKKKNGQKQVHKINCATSNFINATTKFLQWSVPCFLHSSLWS